MVGKKPINGENHEIQIQCPEIKFYENITLLIQIFCPWQLLCYSSGAEQLRQTIWPTEIALWLFLESFLIAEVDHSAKRCVPARSPAVFNPDSCIG